jgi:hypothetical protein
LRHQVPTPFNIRGVSVGVVRPQRPIVRLWYWTCRVEAKHIKHTNAT